MRTFVDRHQTPGKIFRKISLLAECQGCDALQGSVRRILRPTGDQAKLTAGAPDDGFGSVANRVADTVSRMPEGSLRCKAEDEEDDSPQGTSEGGIEERIEEQPPGTAKAEETPEVEQGPFGPEEETSIDEQIVGGFCDPFETQREVRAARRFLRLVMLPAQRVLFGPEVVELYRDFLRRRPNDSLNHKQFIGPESELANAFTRVNETRYTQWNLLNVLESCPLLPNSEWQRFELGEMESDGHVARTPYGIIGFDVPVEDMNFSQPLTIPGHIAGGVSGSAAGPDRRQVSGALRFRAIRDKDGNPVQVEIRPQLRFLVTDAIDFCPGGAGEGFEKKFTVPLSRLEAKGEAYDVPYQVSFDGPKMKFTMRVEAVKADRYILRDPEPVIKRR